MRKDTPKRNGKKRKKFHNAVRKKIKCPFAEKTLSPWCEYGNLNVTAENKLKY